MKCKYCDSKAVKKIWISDMGIVAEVCHYHFRKYWKSRGIDVPVPILEKIKGWMT